MVGDRAVHAGGEAAWAAVDGGGPRGFDAGKMVMGCQRHIFTDTGGRLVAAIVRSAAIQDGDGAVPSPPMPARN